MKHIKYYETHRDPNGRRISAYQRSNIQHNNHGGRKIQSWDKNGMGSYQEELKLFYCYSSLSKEEFVNNYIERKFNYNYEFSHKIDYRDKLIIRANFINRDTWKLLKNENRPSRTMALFMMKEDSPVLLFVHDNGHNKTLAEIISDGMEQINGIKPQKTDDGWVNPQIFTNPDLFINLNNIDIKNYDN